MLYFDRAHISKGIDVNKTSASKECDVCHYWYFLNFSFKFQPNVCNRCHDLLMMSMNLSDIAILNIKGFDYHWITSKNKAINLIQNIDLTEKNETLPSIKINCHIGKDVLMYGDIEIFFKKIYRNRTPIFLKDIDIEKVLVSYKISFGEKT